VRRALVLPFGYPWQPVSSREDIGLLLLVKVVPHDRILVGFREVSVVPNQIASFLVLPR